MKGSDNTTQPWDKILENIKENVPDTYRATFDSIKKRIGDWNTSYRSALGNWINFKETFFAKIQGYQKTPTDLFYARRNFGQAGNERGKFVVNSTKQIIALLVSLERNDQYDRFLELLDKASEQMQSIMDDFQSKTQEIINSRQAKDKWLTFVIGVAKQLRDAAFVLKEIQKGLETPKILQINLKLPKIGADASSDSDSGDNDMLYDNYSDPDSGDGEMVNGVPAWKYEKYHENGRNGGMWPSDMRNVAMQETARPRCTLCGRLARLRV